MSEPYHLKYPTNDEVLECLNRLSRNNVALKADYHSSDKLGIDQVEDWISALKSGKKIVNPITPREKIEAIINKYYPEEGKFLITAHDYEILLFYARKAVKEGEADESQD